jgi:hypothetical protein
MLINQQIDRDAEGDHFAERDCDQKWRMVELRK